MPNAEDVYAHIGVKSGGVALDGEGKYGPNVPDPRKPWAEKSITIDLFAYHGLHAARQRHGHDRGHRDADAAGRQVQRRWARSIHGQLDSLVAHGRRAGRAATIEPYQVSDHDECDRQTVAGPADFTGATALVGYGEIDYVVWPWFVPGVRVEYTRASIEPSSNPGGSSAASLLRVIPGVAMLVRPNIKVVLTGDIERAYGLPTMQSWSPAGGFAVAPQGLFSKFEAEQINATLAVAY